MFTYSYVSLSMQLALKVENGDLIYIGYTDFNLRKVFPAQMPNLEDQKMDKHLNMIRDKHYHIENEFLVNKDDRTVDLKSDVYFYSIKIGSVIMGVERQLLEIEDTAQATAAFNGHSRGF